jgi:hypothetical protein
VRVAVNLTVAEMNPIVQYRVDKSPPLFRAWAKGINHPMLFLEVPS